MSFAHSPDLLALIAYLDRHPVVGIQTWRDWQITPIQGGANNLLYRVAHPTGNYAVKFTIRDDRDRAGREYAALTAIADVGAPIAPRAVLLDQVHYRQPVVVQTWLDGITPTAPPATAEAWEKLLDLYCQIHAITPQRTAVALPAATLNANSGAAGTTLIAQHLARIPAHERPRSLRAICAWLEQWAPPQWPAPPRALCHVDSNWRNFIYRADGWAAVDWENSGWGDPAFEWAELITHPAYADVCDAPWERLILTYAERMDDRTAVQRIAVYTAIMRIWWVVRWARYLYEAPRGLDVRLADRPPTWLADARAGYERSLAQAEQAIGQLL